MGRRRGDRKTLTGVPDFPVHESVVLTKIAAEADGRFGEGTAQRVGATLLGAPTSDLRRFIEVANALSQGQGREFEGGVNFGAISWFFKHSMHDTLR